MNSTIFWDMTSCSLVKVYLTLMFTGCLSSYSPYYLILKMEAVRTAGRPVNFYQSIRRTSQKIIERYVDYLRSYRRTFQLKVWLNISRLISSKTRRKSLNDISNRIFKRYCFKIGTDHILQTPSIPSSGSLFEFIPRHRRSWLKVFVVLLGPTRQIPGL
jgi:hypothetical protein